jgi:hypothetical protein
MLAVYFILQPKDLIAIISRIVRFVRHRIFTIHADHYCNFPSRRHESNLRSFQFVMRSASSTNNFQESATSTKGKGAEGVRK